MDTHRKLGDFLDFKGSRLFSMPKVNLHWRKRHFGAPVIAANAIKDEIYQTLRFTVNVGISSNKLLAKMASDFKKPNHVHTSRVTRNGNSRQLTLNDVFP